MVSREVSVNEIREVLRVWLGWRVTGTGVPQDRRALRRGPQTVRRYVGVPRKRPACVETTMPAHLMTS